MISSNVCGCTAVIVHVDDAGDEGVRSVNLTHVLHVLIYFLALVSVEPSPQASRYYRVIDGCIAVTLHYF